MSKNEGLFKRRKKAWYNRSGNGSDSIKVTLWSELPLRMMEVGERS